MLNERLPRHSPAARGFIRKRRSFPEPRATSSSTASEVFSAPVTFTVVNQISGSSTTPPSTISAKSSTLANSSTIASSTHTSSSSSSSPSSSPSSTIASSTQTVPSVSAVPDSQSSSSNSSPSATNPASVIGTASVHSGLSGGAVAAIAIGVLVLVSAAVVLLGRRYMVARRNQKRGTARWLSGFAAPAMAAGNQSGSFSATVENQPPMTMISPRYGDGYAYTATSAPGSAVGMIGGAAVLAAPPASYNNVPSSAGLNPPSTPILNRAIVRCTFVPKLPDELTVTNGETLDVLQEYDDGWTFCSNSNGERGMVPLECLTSGSETTSDIYGDRSRRSSARVSSVNGRF